MTDDRETHGEELADQLLKNLRGAVEKTEVHSFYSAYEEVFVADKLLRAADNTPPEKMTPERMELIARLAWAQSELIHGYATRCPDDLEGVEALAQEVAAQDHGDSS